MMLANRQVHFAYYLALGYTPHQSQIMEVSPK